MDIEGTSCAAPLVSATVGLMLAANPSLSVPQVKHILRDTSTELESPYFDCGFLNAGLAVQKAKYQEFKKSIVSLGSAEALAGGKVKLKWNDLDVYGPEIVAIYRSTSENGEFPRIKTLSGDECMRGVYVASGLTAGKTYYYKVRIAMRYGSGYQYTPYSEIRSVKVRK